MNSYHIKLLCLDIRHLASFSSLRRAPGHIQCSFKFDVKLRIHLNKMFLNLSITLLEVSSQHLCLESDGRPQLSS